MLQRHVFSKISTNISLVVVESTRNKELTYKEPNNLLHLRYFGCRSFAYVANKIRKKFEVKTKTNVFNRI